jgi:hypothetical protein
VTPGLDTCSLRCRVRPGVIDFILTAALPSCHAVEEESDDARPTAEEQDESSSHLEPFVKK